MMEMRARGILGAIDEGLEETALLVALGYDATQGRPGRHLLNNLLERQGYGRPIDEKGFDRLRPNHPYPREWVREIALAVGGRADMPLSDVIATLRHGPLAQ